MGNGEARGSWQRPAGAGPVEVKAHSRKRKRVRCRRQLEPVPRIKASFQGKNSVYQQQPTA